jgi:hypothetical protein
MNTVCLNCTDQHHACTSSHAPFMHVPLSVSIPHFSHLCVHTPMHNIFRNISSSPHTYARAHSETHPPLSHSLSVTACLVLSHSLSVTACLVRSLCNVHVHMHAGVDAFRWQLGVLPLHGRCVLRRWLHVLPSRHHVPQRRLRMVSDDNVRRGKRHGNPPWCGRWWPRSVQDRRPPNILNNEEERDNSGGLCVDWLRTVCC